MGSMWTGGWYADVYLELYLSGVEGPVMDRWVDAVLGRALEPLSCPSLAVFEAGVPTDSVLSRCRMRSRGECAQDELAWVARWMACRSQRGRRALGGSVFARGKSLAICACRCRCLRRPPSRSGGAIDRAVASTRSGEPKWQGRLHIWAGEVDPSAKCHACANGGLLTLREHS